MNFSSAVGFCSTYLEFLRYVKLTLSFTLPEICFNQSKTTNSIQVLVGYVAFFVTLQVDAK